MLNIELHKLTGSRRPRLWEMQHKCHCPIVGVCFDLGEIRKLVGKLMDMPRRMNDFEIHATAVRECATNSPLARLLHKELDKKYALQVLQFKSAKTPDQLLAQWAQSVAKADIAGALWAALSHAVCDETVVDAVYGDVHMLQHQLGAGQRTEQRLLLQLRRENAALGCELAEIQRRFTGYRDERAAEVSALRELLAAAKADAVRLESLAERYGHELDTLREAKSDTDACLRLAGRAEAAEAENAALKLRLAEIGAQFDCSEADNRRLELELGRILGAAENSPAETGNAEEHLKGCTVLCVGGLSNAAHRYRDLVELRGGAFIHHEGNATENLRRLEAVVAAADAVICQTGCVSHNAYWRVKEQCKRTGKPCTFVGNPSLSSFLHVLDDIAKQREDRTAEENMTD